MPRNRFGPAFGGRGIVFGVALLGATAALAPAQNIHILERTRDARTDSISEAILRAPVEEITRMVSEWREREGELFRLLQSAEARNDGVARRRASEDLAANSREAFAMLTAAF